LQRQQAADFASAAELLAVVLAFDLQGERIVLRLGAFFHDLFRVSFADDFAKRDRLAQWVNQHIQLSFEDLVIEGHVPLVEPNGTDIQRPARGLGVRVLGVEGKGPVRPAISQPFKAGAGLGQVDTRDIHGLGQQRQRRQA